MTQPTTGKKTLLIGGTGTGKTFSIRTYLDCGITPFVLTVEPGIEHVLGDIPPDKLHWKYISPMASSWTDLIDSSRMINRYDQKGISNLTGIKKEKYDQFIKFQQACNDFVCDRTGESFGCIDTWGADRAFITDHLSGLNIMSMNLVVGTKPVRSQGDWGTAMDNLFNTILKLCTDLRCHYTLIAHVERELDELSQSQKITLSTLGNKLAPKIPPWFDDVVMAKREGNKFYWSTAERNTDLRAGTLPISSEIPPSFAYLNRKAS